MGLPVLGGLLMAITSVGGMLMSSKGGGQAPQVKEEQFKGTPEDQKKLDPNRSAAMQKAEERRRALAAGRRREHFKIDPIYPTVGSGLQIRGEQTGV